MNLTCLNCDGYVFVFCISAIHSAKGLEFDNVQVHDDLIDISRFAVAGPVGQPYPAAVGSFEGKMWEKSAANPPCFYLKPDEHSSEEGRVDWFAICALQVEVLGSLESTELLLCRI